MKIAISGKGGVGKTTIAAAMALLLAAEGKRVLLIDADPDGSLAAALGLSAAAQKEIVPIARQRALIEERTGAKVKEYGQMFKLNPAVADIADKYAVKCRGVDLLVLGAIEAGGSGCACPESVLLRSLVQHLLLQPGENLIMDMEAGLEHLGRATAKGVDAMLIVVEPDRRSADSARRITRMAGEIGIRQMRLVANKIRNAEDDAFIRAQFRDADGAFLATIPWCESLRAADRQGASVVDSMSPAVREGCEEILRRLGA